jgi:ATP-dependent Clp protease ATP-binding subunit ClpC
MFARMPVLINQPASGVAVAQLIDGLSHQALGGSIEQALRILKRNLVREVKRHRISTLTTWQSATLHTKQFLVQPAVIHKDRRYPTGPKVALPVRYIEMLDDRDQLFCMLPDFGEFLYIPEGPLLKTMLSETVRSLTATLTPREIHRLWPAERSEIRWMRLTLAEPARYQAVESAKVLRSVAEPLNERRNLALPSGARDRELSLMRDAFTNGSCLIVGETGVGKSTLIASVARDMQLARRAELKKTRQKAESQHAPSPMFWTSSGGRLIAGMRYLGQWQQRLEAVVAEIGNLDGVLVIENLLDLVSVGGREPRDSLAAFLLPYIRSGSLRLVAEASPTELDACRRLLPPLVDALPAIHIAPLGVDHERELLRITLTNRLQSTQLEFSPEIPACIARVCRQFQSHTAPPGASMRFVEELTSRRRDQSLPELLTIPWVLERFSKRTGLPRILLDDSLTLTREQVTAELELDVIGQPAACAEVASVITKIKSAVQDPRRPFGCLLFCGPTGVGKTQLAKSLGQYLFGAKGDKLPLTRLDMSEYSGAAAGYRFLNDAEGNSARWIQQIRSHPLSVLLLDEIEKASREVFDILLSVLDEGRLTDKLGRVTSFRNTVILMTSNIGAKTSTTLGFSDDSQIDYVSEVRKAFRPEFFNRLDSVIPFKPLSREVMRQITEKELSDLRQREGLQRYGRQIRWTDELVDYLTQAGFAPQLGARPLQRVVETDVVAPLSKTLVEHTLTSQGTAANILLHWSGGALVVEIN